MITIVIGQSGSGKTTFVKGLLKEPYRLVKDEIVYTEAADGTIALGKYGIGIRTEGTDTLSYSSAEAILRLVDKYSDRNIVLEGDRINNSRVFEHLRKKGYDVRLYLVRCSLKTSMQRLRKAGSQITPTFVKCTKTKAENNYLKYSRYFPSEIINTDGGEK